MLAFFSMANLVLSDVWALLVAISVYLLLYKMNVHICYST